jgi:hypothetical protein
MIFLLLSVCLWFGCVLDSDCLFDRLFGGRDALAFHGLLERSQEPALLGRAARLDEPLDGEKRVLAERYLLARSQDLSVEPVAQDAIFYGFHALPDAVLGAAGDGYHSHIACLWVAGLLVSKSLGLAEVRFNVNTSFMISLFFFVG